MNIYYLGNQDLNFDNQAIIAVKKLKTKFKEINFICVDPNEDLPFFDQDKVIILDTVSGIDDIKIIVGKDFNKLELSPKVSVHDFDLAFQLTYLFKLKKIKEVIIIGLPMSEKINYFRLQSVIRSIIV